MQFIWYAFCVGTSSARRELTAYIKLGSGEALGLRAGGLPKSVCGELPSPYYASTALKLIS